MVPVYSNISDNATFHMHINESQIIYDIEILHSFNSTRRRIFRFHFFYIWPDLEHVHTSPHDPRYRDRIVLSIDKNVTDGLRRFNVTLVDVQQSDNGTYIIQPHPLPLRWNETSFVIYALGKDEDNYQSECFDENMQVCKMKFSLQNKPDKFNFSI